jgi:Fructose-bisphosphate aldolase class-II
MALVTMRQLLDEAAKGGYGVGAFNVNNLEQVQAIMEAARETESPVHAKDYDPISLPDMVVRYKEQGHQLTVA